MTTHKDGDTRINETQRVHVDEWCDGSRPCAVADVPGEHGHWRSHSSVEVAALLEPLRSHLATSEATVTKLSRQVEELKADLEEATGGECLRAEERDAARAESAPPVDPVPRRHAHRRRRGLTVGTLTGPQLQEIDLFLQEVRAEIIRAREKFPRNALASVALMEEVGELAKAVLDETTARARLEAVQVACMAFRVGVEGDRSTDDHRWRKGLGVIAGEGVEHGGRRG